MALSDICFLALLAFTAGVVHNRQLDSREKASVLHSSRVQQFHKDDCTSGDCAKGFPEKLGELGQALKEYKQKSNKALEAKEDLKTEEQRLAEMENGTASLRAKLQREQTAVNALEEEISARYKDLHEQQARLAEQRNEVETTEKVYNKGAPVEQLNPWGTSGQLKADEITRKKSKLEEAKAKIARDSKEIEQDEQGLIARKRRLEEGWSLVKDAEVRAKVLRESVDARHRDIAEHERAAERLAYAVRQQEGIDHVQVVAPCDEHQPHVVYHYNDDATESFQRKVDRLSKLLPSR